MMSRTIFILVVLMLALALTGCDALGTDDSKDDDTAAQSFFPAFSGYAVQETGDIQDSIAAALGSAALLTGNPIQAALVERTDTILDCFRERGAADAKIYMEQVSGLTDLRIPVAGVLAVINQDRAARNFLDCALGPVLQTAMPEPCVGSGSFESNGEKILYLYAATDRPLCDLFDQHFSQYK